MPWLYFFSDPRFIALIVFAIVNIVRNIRNANQTRKYNKILSDAAIIKPFVADTFFVIEKTNYGHVLRTGTLAERYADRDVIENDYSLYQVGNMKTREITNKIPEEYIGRVKLEKQENKDPHGLMWDPKRAYSPQATNSQDSKQKNEMSAISSENQSKLSDFIKD